MRSFIFIFILLFALPALGQTWQRQPDCTSAVGGTAKVSSGQSIYYCTTAAVDSNIFDITAASATVCFDPNIATTGTGNGSGYLRKCLGKTATENTCGKLLVSVGIASSGVDNVALNGDDGSISGYQKRCIYGVPRGRYFFDMAVSAGGQTAIVAVEGN